MFSYLSSFWSGPATPTRLSEIEGTLFKAKKCIFQCARLVLEKAGEEIHLTVNREDEFVEQDEITRVSSLAADVVGFSSPTSTSFTFQIQGDQYTFEFEDEDAGAKFYNAARDQIPIKHEVRVPVKHEAHTPVKREVHTPVKHEAHTPVKPEVLSPIKNEVTKTPDRKAHRAKVASPTFAGKPKVEGSELFSTTGILAAHSPDGKNQLVIGADIKIVFMQQGKFDFVVGFMNSRDEDLYHWNLEEDVALEWLDNQYTISWIASVVVNGKQQQFSFCFNTISDYRSFKTSYSNNLLAAKRKETMKVTTDDADWVAGGLSTMFSSMRIEDEEDDMDDFDDDEVVIETPKTPSIQTPIKGNSLLSVGRCRKDRSYVVRGDQLGAFSPAKGKMQYIGSNSISSTKGTPFSPSHAMLHQGDEKLLLLHPTDKNKVYCMDIERGKVMEEWSTEGLHTSKILPETKDAQVQGKETFLGINNAGFFVMDSRAKEKVVRAFQYKDAKTTAFTCAATTEDGHMAVGTKLGEVRLFNQSSLAKGGKNYIEQTAPRAKTKLLGYGDPVLGIDTTRDGKFVLSTCATYLLLTPVASESSSGFQTSYKQHPYRLSLRPPDVLKVGGKVQFTPAKFNVVGSETFIVTSTANWLITWDFSELVSGEVSQSVSVPYSMTRLRDVVVADDFSSESKGDIVLSLPEDVVVHTARATPSKRR